MNCDICENEATESGLHLCHECACALEHTLERVQHKLELNEQLVSYLNTKNDILLELLRRHAFEVWQTLNDAQEAHNKNKQDTKIKGEKHEDNG